MRGLPLAAPVGLSYVVLGVHIPPKVKEADCGFVQRLDNETPDPFRLIAVEASGDDACSRGKPQEIALTC